MKTALVHDWLTGFGGGERVLEAVAELFPGPIYTLVKNEDRMKDSCFAEKEVHTSFIQSFPFAQKQHRYYLPFFPKAIEGFDLGDRDLILSLSHAAAKGVLTHSDQLHICYCFTPMRYAWDLSSCYLQNLFFLKKLAVQYTLSRLRKWDVASASRVNVFVAISHYISERIQRIYQRPAPVIYPPVNTHEFSISQNREEYYITCSRMVPYKKIDLIVEAFAQMLEKRLLVIGEGPEMKKIHKKAKKNVELLGSLSDRQVSDLVSKAKAFIFAAEEDFGIAPVEAQASGIPVIAFGKGGALETVLDGKTGVFFHEQSPSSIIEAVKVFEKKQSTFDPLLIKHHAEKFSVQRFKEEFSFFVNKKMQEFYENRHLSRR